MSKHQARSYRDHGTATTEFIVYDADCGHVKVGFNSREAADQFADLHNESGATVFVNVDQGALVFVGTETWEDPAPAVDAPAVDAPAVDAPAPVRRGRIQAPPRVPAVVDPEQRRAIRSWAERSGITCPTRGRIPANVIDQFNEAGGKPIRKGRTRASR